jgi:FG-GAP-like repeat
LIFCSEDDVTLGATNVHEYYWNDGTAHFTAAPFTFPDSKSNAVITADINGDNWPDVLFGNDGQNRIFINDQSGGFVEETDSRLPAIEDLSQDLALADVDGDGDLDLFAGNEDGNRLLLNNGSGVFSDVTLDRLPQGLNMETRKAIFADVDLDGDQDVYLCNVAFIPGKDRQNRLYLNDGNGFFTDATATHLPAELKHSLDAVFVDINNDGDLDLFVCGISISNGSLGAAPIDAYFNDGSGVFTPNNLLAFGPDYLVKGLGLFAADYNGDGKTDIYVCDRKDNHSNTKDVLLLAAVTSPVSNFGHLPDAINLFPNPGKQNFTLVFNNMAAVNTSFGLYDDTGKRVATPTVNQLSPNRFLLDCSDCDLSAGIYWLLIGNGGRQWYKQWRVRG